MFLSGLILVGATTAGVLDVKFRRIPNWLVVSTAATALFYHSYSSGWIGLWNSFAGLLLATAILFPLFLLRGMGAGDVKYFGALGAAVAYSNVVVLLMLAAFAAGVLVVVLCGRAAVVGALMNLQGIATRSMAGDWRSIDEASAGHARASSVPFGAAMALACWALVLWKGGL